MIAQANLAVVAQCVVDQLDVVVTVDAGRNRRLGRGAGTCCRTGGAGSAGSRFVVDVVEVGSGEFRLGGKA